jgi:hypothetical protein
VARPDIDHECELHPQPACLKLDDSASDALATDINEPCDTEISGAKPAPRNFGHFMKSARPSRGSKEDGGSLDAQWRIRQSTSFVSALPARIVGPAFGISGVLTRRDMPEIS